MKNRREQRLSKGADPCGHGRVSAAPYASVAYPTQHGYLATIANILGQGQCLAGTLRAHAEALYAQGFPPDEAVHCLQVRPPSFVGPAAKPLWPAAWAGRAPRPVDNK